MRAVPLAAALLSAALSLPLLPTSLPGQQGDDDVQIRVQRAGGQVYMLAGRGGNIGALAAEDGVLLVDDQFAPLAPKIRAAVDSLGSGGDVAGMIEAVERILDSVPDDAAVIPGHGSLSNVEELREYHRMLVETTGHVRRQMERGTELPEIKAGGLPAEWEGWATDFVSEERWIETIFRSYGG